MARILVTGGSGRLGSAIRQAVDCIAPTHAELDVLDYLSCLRAIARHQPDTVIHSAGYANALKAETDREACWRLNAYGARNMARACDVHDRRLIFISTDYVFDGEDGNYAENDTPNPINFYGVSKLAAEMAVGEHTNTLILRAPFRADPPWRFPRAFTDQWTSCRFASEVAPDIVAAALSWQIGMLHIGGPRRSIYELAAMASPGILKRSREDFPGLRIPRDTSLNSEKWHSLRKASQQSFQPAATSI